MDEADWFKEKEKALKKDRAFKTELKAYETLEKIRMGGEKCGLLANPNSPKQTRNKSSFVKAIESLKKKYGDTVAAVEADKLLDRVQ